MGEIDIKEMVQYTNLELKKGLSTAQIEKKIKVGKDTLRKRLNRAGYRYNKDLNQYVTQDNTNVLEDITQSNTLCYKGITQDNTLCYKKEFADYNIKNKNIVEAENKMENIELEKFKVLSIEEKVELINQLTEGKKFLKDIVKEIGFTNVSNYMDKSLCYWDGTTKTYKLIEQQGQFTQQEVSILKELIKSYNTQKQVNNFNLDCIDDKTITTRSFRSYKVVMDNFSKFCKDNKINQTEALAIALNNFMDKK